MYLVLVHGIFLRTYVPWYSTVRTACNCCTIIRVLCDEAWMRGCVRDTGMSVLERARFFLVRFFIVISGGRGREPSATRGLCFLKSEPSNSHLTSIISDVRSTDGCVPQRSIPIWYVTLYKQGFSDSLYSHMAILWLRDTSH